MVGTSRTLTDPLEMVIVVVPWATGKLSGEVNAGQEIVAVPTARVPVASNSVSEMSVVAWARQITEPAVRVGELIVKGTCHICHDATGPDDKPTTVMSGVIPSLAGIPQQKTLVQFLQKLREGAPVPLSARGAAARGRMPVFNYLSEAEATAAYSYLIAYPPK